MKDKVSHLSIHFCFFNCKDSVRLHLNRGKDFSYKTVEVNAFGEGSTFTAFSAAQYELYREGMHNFLTKYQVNIIYSISILNHCEMYSSKYD